MSTKSLIHLCWATCLLGYSMSAMAAENNYRYYDVELVIFEHTANLARVSERSRTYAPWSLPETIVQLDMPNAVPPEMTGVKAENYYQPLKPEQYHLTAEARKLVDSGEYRIIKHFAWRQPGLPRESTRPVLVQQTLPPPTLNSLAPSPQSAEPPVQTKPVYTEARLNGQISVGLSRYLHLGVELYYELVDFQPDTDSDKNPLLAENETQESINPELPKTVVYKIEESRRLRSKELHYLDHPLVGVLAIIMPVEDEEKPAH